MLQALSLWKTIDKHFLLKPIEEIEAQRFVMQMAGMLRQTDKAQTEEAEALAYELILKDFFAGIFGEESISCRSNLTFKHTEVAINQRGKCKIAGFVVPPDQRISMLTRKQLNKPVFHQAICTYLFEYFLQGNQDITYIWISNVLEWFIFDANDLQKWLKQEIAESESLWDMIESHSLQPLKWAALIQANWRHLTASIPAICFNLYGFQEELADSEDMEGRKLLGLQKLFSPTHLLKYPPSEKADSVKSLFFRELFYIMGVEEMEQKNGNRLHRLGGEAHLLSQFEALLKEKNKEDNIEIENEAWFACVYAVCQLLLFKVIEAHQQTFATENQEKTSPQNFKSFNKLFSTLPALTEKSTIISFEDLVSSMELRVYADTVLKDHEGNSLQFQGLSLFEYLMKWLDAYVFVLDYSPRIQKSRTFIHLNDIIEGLQKFSVLNQSKPALSPEFLEKLCREPLKKAVIRVFNEKNNWTCTSFKSLETQVAQITVKSANACMDQLSLCNPASSSGDVLIYCFHEWLRLKMRLGILSDGNGEFLPYYESYTHGNSNWWLEKEGDFYAPIADNPESLRLLSAMRHEFHHVFTRVFLGVESNELEVIITYTRLYLLYLQFTFPQEDSPIDFPVLKNNIRHANPLISRFPMDMDIQKALAPTPYGFEDYKYVVQLMKIARSSTEIEEAQHMLRQFKQLFRAHVSNADRRHKRLERLEQTYHKSFMTLTLLDFGGAEKEKDEKRIQMEAEITKLKAELQAEAKGVWYEQAFEWRLEFPEILDAQGQFVGFDLVICLPPAMRQDQLGALRHYFKRRYKTYNYQAKLFMYYIELGINLLKKDGCGVWVLPLVWTSAQYASSLRDWIVNYYLELFEAADEPQLHTQGKLVLQNTKKDWEFEHVGNKNFEAWLTKNQASSSNKKV